MTINGKSFPITTQKTLLDVLKMLQVNEKTVVIEHNGTIVPRDLLESTTISEEDTLEVISFVGGG